jgi:hypothetical protein
MDFSRHTKQKIKKSPKQIGCWSLNSFYPDNQYEPLKQNSILSFGSIIVDQSMIPNPVLYKSFIDELSSNLTYPLTLITRHTKLFQWIESYSFFNDRTPSQKELIQYYTTIGGTETEF